MYLRIEITLNAEIEIKASEDASVEDTARSDVVRSAHENVGDRSQRSPQETSMTEKTRDEIVNLVMTYFETFESELFEKYGHSGDPEVLTEEQIRREAQNRHAVAAQLTQAAIAATAS